MATRIRIDGTEYLTPAEVGRLFRVKPASVSRWARQGKLDYILTPGGRMMFPREAVEKFCTIGGAS